MKTGRQGDLELLARTKPARKIPRFQLSYGKSPRDRDAGTRKELRRRIKAARRAPEN